MFNTVGKWTGGIKIFNPKSVMLPFSEFYSGFSLICCVTAETWAFISLLGFA